VQGPPSSKRKCFKKDFPVTVKIRTSGYQTLGSVVTCTKFTSNHNSQLFVLYTGVLCTWVKLDGSADSGL